MACAWFNMNSVQIKFNCAYVIPVADPDLARLWEIELGGALLTGVYRTPPHPHPGMGVWFGGHQTWGQPRNLLKKLALKMRFRGVFLIVICVLPTYINDLICTSIVVYNVLN